MKLNLTIFVGMLLLLHRVVTAQQFSEAIEDNSFFIEEAYNQEARVVQHISNTVYTMNPDHEFIFAFTQEWPVSTEIHQLSYTLSYIALNSNLNRGAGDIVINYRHQISSRESWAVVAPRLSLILPTGDRDRGLGNGVIGLQANIPVSKRISDKFILHANVGGTVLPSVKGLTGAGEEVQRTLTFASFGLSGIWLAERYDNFMLESILTSESSIGGNGDVLHEQIVLVNPAYRHAIDIGELEIVPGIGFPVTISKTSTEFGIFFYLSFEHSY